MTWDSDLRIIWLVCILFEFQTPALYYYWLVHINHNRTFSSNNLYPQFIAQSFATQMTLFKMTYFREQTTKVRRCNVTAVLEKSHHVTQLTQYSHANHLPLSPPVWLHGHQACAVTHKPRSIVNTDTQVWLNHSTNPNNCKGNEVWLTQSWTKCIIYRKMSLHVYSTSITQGIFK
jgi:hypothetical protein